MPIFERSKSVRVSQLNDTSLEVAAHLKDRFHEIKTVMVFDSESKTILKAEAEMITVPFDLCHEVCAKMHELEGLQVKKGVNKWVKEIVGNSRGCTHLVDLVMESFKAVFQVTGFCLFPAEMPFDEKLQKIQAMNAGICHTYSNLNRHPRYIGNRDI